MSGINSNAADKLKNLGRIPKDNLKASKKALTSEKPKTDTPFSIRLPTEEKIKLKQEIEELKKAVGAKGISEAKYIRAALINFQKKSSENKAKAIRELW